MVPTIGWIYFGLMIAGLVGFIASMCIILYHFWRRPKQDEALPDGQYHIHFMGHNKHTGAPIYDVEQTHEDTPEEKAAFEQRQLEGICDQHQG